MSTFEAGQLVIAIFGSNPWWPARIVKRENNVSTIKFFDLDEQLTVNDSNVLDCSTMRLYEDYRALYHPEKNPYNFVLDSMKPDYIKSWNSLKDALYPNQRSISERLATFSESLESEKKEFCQVCLRNIAESFDLNTAHKLINMSALQRDIYFDKLRIDYGMKQCSSKCKWKYHDSCLKFIEDSVCWCDKIEMTCNICHLKIDKEDLFVCNDDFCRLTYHQSCLKFHKELFDNYEVCPVHYCINCKLDNLSESSESSNKFTTCIICKTTFHWHSYCLPRYYIEMSRDKIICQRHLIDLKPFQRAKTGFCFKCCSEVEPSQIITCKFCIITYHKSSPCLPGWIDSLSDDGQFFICNTCKFPFCRRALSPYLILPQSDNDLDSVYLWKVGNPTKYEPIKTELTLKRIVNTETELTSNHLAQSIVVSIQSCDNLVCFGLLRYVEMQTALKSLSDLINKVRGVLNMTAGKRIYPSLHNWFVLYCSDVFPIRDNVYRIPLDEIIDQSMVNNQVKCQCIEKCSIIQRNGENFTDVEPCINIINNRECTQSTCNMGAKNCSNRQLQTTSQTNLSLILTKNFVGSSLPYAQFNIRQNINKYNLVVELVGEVKSKAASYSDETGQNGLLKFNLTKQCFIDCNKYCSISRFIQHSSTMANLSARVVYIDGIPRLGLYANQFITKGDELSIDYTTIRYNSGTGDFAATYIIPLPSLWIHENNQSEHCVDTTRVKSDVKYTPGTFGDVGGNDIKPTTSSDSMNPPEGSTNSNQQAYTTIDCNGAAAVTIAMIDTEVKETRALLKKQNIDAGKVYNRSAKKTRRIIPCKHCNRDVGSVILDGPPLIHCIECFSKFHIHCAYKALNLTDPSNPNSTKPPKISKLVNDPRLHHYLCWQCRSRMN